MQRRTAKKRGDSHSASTAAIEAQPRQAVVDTSASASDDAAKAVISRLARQLALAAVRIVRQKQRIE